MTLSSTSARLKLVRRYVPPRRGDFTGGIPDVAYVYAVTMGTPAAAWHAESERVLGRGDSRPAVHGGERIDWGYRLLLADVHHMAGAMVRAGRGGELLTGVYIGREARGIGSKSRFSRVFDGAGSDSDR